MRSSANIFVKICKVKKNIYFFKNSIESRQTKKTGLTVDHFWSHPVRVTHHGVSLPPVGFLHTLKLPQFVLVLVFYHKASEAEVSHHNAVVLRKIREKHIQEIHVETLSIFVQLMTDFRIWKVSVFITLWANRWCYPGVVGCLVYRHVRRSVYVCPEGVFASRLRARGSTSSFPKLYVSGCPH